MLAMLRSKHIEWPARRRDNFPVLSLPFMLFAGGYMEVNIIRTLVALGVPGVALGIFYLLLRSFKFRFAQVSPEWTAIVAILFLFVVGGITLYALHLWRPSRASRKQNDEKELVFEVDGEAITLSEIVRSVHQDVIKVNAYTHPLGVAAEYEWKRLRYPDSKMVMQSLVAMKVPDSTNKEGEREVYFDKLEIELADGRRKELYFDISSFFDGAGSSLIDPDAFMAKKIAEMYRR